MILDDIIQSTAARVASLDHLPAGKARNPRSLEKAIRSVKERNAIIAELKYASPSRGKISGPADPQLLAADFVNGGCVALSVLTEPRFFGGRSEVLTLVRDTVEVPVLRKDFIIDERQLEETRALGADAVLLIARVLGDRLASFVDYARDLNIEPLVEVHTRDELKRALGTDATLIGINNRNLDTMEISLYTTLRLAPQALDAGRVVVSESGLIWPCDVRFLRFACHAYLIGSAIMASADPKKRLEGFVSA